MCRPQMEFELTPRQRSVLIGTLMGDGHLWMGKKSKVPSLHLGHGTNQREYLIWKAQQFGALFSRLEPYEYERSNFAGKQFHLASRCHSSLSPYRQLFYPQGQKVVTPEILSSIDELALAVWYADDGTLRWNQKIPKIMFYAGGLTESEYLLIENFLRMSFGKVSRHYIS